MTQSSQKTYSPNKAIDAAIREMLPSFSDESQRRMEKAIRDVAKAATAHQDETTDAHARHIFREFIPAFILNRCGYKFEYNVSLGGRTPDWFDREAGLIMDGYTFERGGSSQFLDRVNAAVTEKSQRYEDIAVKFSSRFVVSVYLDFLTAVTVEECIEDYQSFSPIFIDNSILWAIIFFSEGTPGISIARQCYSFFSIIADDTFETMERWKLPSFCVHG